MNFYKKLVGEQVYLSPISDTEEAARIFTRWSNNRNVSNALGMSASLPLEFGMRLWLDKAKKAEGDEFDVMTEDKVFAIVTIENDEMIGYSELRNLTISHRTATVGMTIGDSENMGKGYGTDALKLLLKYGFCDFGLHSINLTVIDGNARALRSYEKAGFKAGGKQRESAFINGKFVDRIYMDILAEEYLANNKDDKDDSEVEV